MSEVTSAQPSSDGTVALERSSLAWTPPSRFKLGRIVGLTLVWGIFVGNIVVIVWLWATSDVDNLNVTNQGELYNSIGRITGLLSAYLALVQIVLLARLPWLERLVSFDRLTVWHRWNGFACFWLLIAHCVFQIWGYAKLDFPPQTFWDETWALLTNGVYPGMVTATIGTILVVAVTVSSLVILRRRLPYELWYAVHLTAYAGIALGYFHQIPTGGDLVKNDNVIFYWKSLYVVTIVLIVWRVLWPVFAAIRYRLRIDEVVQEGPGVVSIRMSGRNVDRLRARAGQFFLWRFLARGYWWTSHPYSLSAAPDGSSLRITVKALGNHSGKLARLTPGTRVAIEGPYGSFTEATRRRSKVLLVGGGIGITPVRALVEQMDGDVIVLYRVISDDDLVLSNELAAIAAERGVKVHNVVGDHRTPEGRELLTPAHLRELVPDVAEREVYLCGPPAMTDVLTGELRRAGVPRRHMHVERFAL